MKDPTANDESGNENSSLLFSNRKPAENSGVMPRIREAIEDPWPMAKLFMWVFAAHLLLALFSLCMFFTLPDTTFYLSLLLTFPLCCLMEQPALADFTIAYIMFILINGTRWGLVAVISAVVFKRWWLLPLINAGLAVLAALFFLVSGPLKM
jgi:hypothetical protein